MTTAYPLRAVLEDPRPRIREGRGGVLGPDTDRRARWWHLECGHTTERDVRYRPLADKPGRGNVRSRSRDDVLPPPSRVVCGQCEPAAS